jgi:ribonucleoside-diphosphate reductase alpha chain
MAKEGSTLSGILDGFALSVSIGLQYGVPLKALVDKLINTRFEPSGYTGHPEIPYAKSILDYMARWLGGHFISADYLTRNAVVAEAAPQFAAPAAEADDPAPARAAAIAVARPVAGYDGAPTCSECGMLMTPNGACYKCENCGGTSGCS